MSYETLGYPPPTSYYGYGDQHKHPAYEQRIADLEAKVDELTELVKQLRAQAGGLRMPT